VLTAIFKSTIHLNIVPVVC